MAEAVGGPTVLRLLLGAQLRRLREARGISAQQAARTIRGSESKISRIELGRNSVREIDIADLLSLYGITDAAEREQLLSLASRANQPGWWHRYHDVLPPWFQAYIGLEESAQSIRSYDMQFVPGLLQTEEYAAAVLALGEFSLDEAERLVVLRKERQRRFAAGGIHLWAVVDEIALRRPIGGLDVLRGQLRELGEACRQPWLTLQVTPFPGGEPRRARLVQHLAVRRSRAAGHGVRGAADQRHVPRQASRGGGVPPGHGTAEPGQRPPGEFTGYHPRHPGGLGGD